MSSENATLEYQDGARKMNRESEARSPCVLLMVGSYRLRLYIRSWDFRRSPV